jgi:DAK2 domain fusion protein YloV
LTQHSYSDTMLRSEKWLRCNGWQLQKLTNAGLVWLEQNHQHVNSLNVFPVPDGDTGTNMLLTMRSAVARISDNSGNHVGNVAAEISQGALMGARGNSGVILSQIWRGLAKGLKGKEIFDAHDLAEAFQLASDTAYNGVMRPVEGTILTVIREGAEEAAIAVKQSRDLRFILDQVLRRSKDALQRTPEMLPVLKQAGVVDSGGQGLVYIFEGMLRYVSGQMHELSEIEGQYRKEMERMETAQELAAPEDGQIDNPYDVQFILIGDNLDVMEVRQHIDAMGDSTVVVGDEQTIKVHIHVKDPGEPLAYGVSLGKITDVVVENMQLQMEEFINGPAQANGGNPISEAVVEPRQIGVVAVAAGDGLAEVFKSLGVDYIVQGGQTNNPSTEEIYQAIQDLPNDKIIVLPNNKNIHLAAEAASNLSPKLVTVVPTQTIPEGFGAMLAFRPDADLEDTTREMYEAAQQVSTGQLTRATRSVTLDGVEVKEGHIIGLVDGHLCSSGPEIEAVLSDVLESMDTANCEIVSIYYGADVDEQEAVAMAGKIESIYANVEIELLPGGQPHYFYILGAE